MPAACLIWLPACAHVLAADGQGGAAADALAQPHAATRRPQAAALLPAGQVRRLSTHAAPALASKPRGRLLRLICRPAAGACTLLLPRCPLALAAPPRGDPRPGCSPSCSSSSPSRVPAPRCPRCAATSSRTWCPGERQTARRRWRVAWRRSPASQPRSGRASGESPAPPAHPAAARAGWQRAPAGAPASRCLAGGPQIWLRRIGAELGAPPSRAPHTLTDAFTTALHHPLTLLS